MVKKEQKYLPVGVLEKFSKISQSLQGKTGAGGPFIVELQPVIAYKRLLGQLFQKCDAYTETLTQVLSINSKKNFDLDY